MSSAKFVYEAVRNYAVHLAANCGRFRLPKKAENPFKMGCDPELDTILELDPDADYYLTVICILRWIIELGRINIIIELLLLSSHLALPKEGHFTCSSTCHVPYWLET